MYLGIEGIPGVGKTTACKALSERLGWRVLFEPVKAVEEAGLLKDFYEAPAKHAFVFQTYMLHARFRLQQLACYEEAPVILDRTLAGDWLFAEAHALAGNITKHEWWVYQQAYEVMTAIRPPFLLLFLDVAPEVAYARVRARARPSEANMTLGYLTGLRDRYESLLSRIQIGNHRWRGTSVMRYPWLDGMDKDENWMHDLVTLIKRRMA